MHPRRGQFRSRGATQYAYPSPGQCRSDSHDIEWPTLTPSLRQTDIPLRQKHDLDQYPDKPGMSRGRHRPSKFLIRHGFQLSEEALVLGLSQGEAKEQRMSQCVSSRGIYPVVNLCRPSEPQRKLWRNVNPTIHLISNSPTRQPQRIAAK